MKHGCSTLLFHCIDFRLQEHLAAFAKNEKLVGDCDVMALPGVAKTIARPDWTSNADFVMEQIDIPVRLHGVQKVVLMNHTDCGAYGGRKAFPSAAEERTAHLADMTKAREMICTRHPGLSVNLMLAVIAEDGAVTFEKLD